MYFPSFHPEGFGRSVAPPSLRGASEPYSPPTPFFSLTTTYSYFERSSTAMGCCINPCKIRWLWNQIFSALGSTDVAVLDSKLVCSLESLLETQLLLKEQVTKEGFGNILLCANCIPGLSGPDYFHSCYSHILAGFLHAIYMVLKIIQKLWLVWSTELVVVMETCLHAF